MSDREEAARAQLRARQGAGARYDHFSAPHVDLSLVRQGTAYFARLLMNMTDEQLSAPSRAPGISRREIVARVGLEARFLAETVAWVRVRSDQPLPIDQSVVPSEVDFISTLPSQALRNLFSHSEVHLNVEWRDLDAEGWNAIITDRSGRPFPIDTTPRLRAHSIWHNACQLGLSSRVADIPKELRD